MALKGIIATGLLAALLSSSLRAQQVNTAGKDDEWTSYGRDAGGSRYSPLHQINTGNIAALKPAWTYQTGELKVYDGTKAKEKAAFEATPIMVDRTIFLSTPSCRVIAIDPSTGVQKWIFDPKINLKNDFSEITSRGVSVWPTHDHPDYKSTAKKIFIATIDGRLIALNAKTGTPVLSFGNDGTVNLREGFGNELSVTSPPCVIGNLVVVGSSMGDNQRFDYPRGTVRAYDVISGNLRWSWDPIPTDSTDEAWKTWKGQKAHQTGAANAWAVISCDAARDLVFIPTSSPSPDFYGGERLGQNLYGNAIVALRASTGKMVWFFQVVHHDLWDYDIAAQPVLMDVNRNGKKIPAVAVGTKMGHIFILNRETGESLFPVEERAVPPSTIEGEEANATQPFPIFPAPLGLQNITPEDAWGITPEDKKEAEKKIAEYLNNGPFTPPSYQGTIMAPGNVGGIHWGGMCFDPEQGLLITNINRVPALIRMLPREKLARLEQEDETLLRAETGRQAGTPYVMKRSYLFKVIDGNMMMLTSPPWGTLLSIDVNSGAKKWEVPLGYMLDPGKYPGAEKWGSVNFGGAIVTAGNLLFVAATMDNHLRAFNTKTGALLWEYLLPASAQATPMSYEMDGKQYVVIAAGGHGKLGSQQGDYVMAFSLP
ncbi:MAG TPA: pyrroloquinoline quinone-dependent dehydrogenase [Agriterribacter sp.]|nr:pyrroloquinoline quinone-dependent dehydrogenase [Agriterribacter sp.]